MILASGWRVFGFNGRQADGSCCGGLGVGGGVGVDVDVVGDGEIGDDECDGVGCSLHGGRRCIRQSECPFKDARRDGKRDDCDDCGDPNGDGYADPCSSVPAVANVAFYSPR